MISSKAENSSRRSSILKLPKVRQPFQTVESNGAPMEDSPIKFKRRVSFAEKKHVREFCDSVEQGTVWNNTYEENDSSLSKANLPSNTNDNTQIQVLSELSNTLNYQLPSDEAALDNQNLFDSIHRQCHQSNKVLVRQDAIDLDHLSPEEIHSHLEPNNVKVIVMSANPELLANKENIPAVLKLSRLESSLIEDEELLNVQKLSQNFNYSQRFSVYCDDNMEEAIEDNSLNKTDHQDISMDCTMPATDSILSYQVDNTINEQKEVNGLIGTTETTRVFQNSPMEMTEPVSSILSSKLREMQNGTSIFHNKSMETTEIVPTSYSTIQQSNIKMNNFIEITQAATSSKISTNSQRIEDDATQFFHNKSMELTEAVSSRRPEIILDERTQVFNNKSMEITEAVPSLYSRQFCGNKTQVFHDKSMEMTEVASQQPSMQFFEDRTQVFHNKSMEMTEVVSQKSPRQFSEDRTQVFNNKSMEMTEAISSIPTGPLFENKTKVFHDNSMKITEAVGIQSYSKHQEQLPIDEIQFSHNQSMEMTEAIEHHQLSTTATHENNSPVIKNILNTSNRTEIFHNYCMEHTEPIPSLKRQYHQIFNGNKKSDGELGSPNAKNLCNSSIIERRQVSEKDLEALHRVLHQNLDNSVIKSTFSSGNCANFHDQSMEMTAVVPTHFTQLKNSNQQDLSDQNVSMEITEAVPSIFNTKKSMINICEDAPIVPECEMIRENCMSDSLRQPKTLEPLGISSNSNFGNCIEQLRYRSSSISKSPNDDVTYDFTAPICIGKDNNNVTDDLENIEAPSFVFADISAEIPEHEINGEDEEEMMNVSIPQVSITEDFNTFKNRRRTYVISHNEIEKNEEIHEPIDESKIVMAVEETKRSLVETLEDIRDEEVNKKADVPDKINSSGNKTVCDDNNQTNKRRRTKPHVINKDVEDTELGRRKIIRSSTYLIKPAVNQVQEEISTDKDGTNDESIEQKSISLSTSIYKSSSQSNIIEKNIISPVKKINLEFAALADNDMILARIEKQRKIMAAMVAKKNSLEAVENQVVLKNTHVSIQSTTEENIKSRYDILIDHLNEISNETDCIWKVHSTSPNTICIEYCMTALLLGIVFNVPEYPNELEKLERVCIIPRIADKESVILRITDRLIVETIDVESFPKNYKTYDDVVRLIEYITNEVNSIFDFYHELKRLSRLNSMKIYEEKISFNVWTKQMKIILNISINIKPFIDIHPEDIDVKCLLGSIRTNDVKNLIKNIKRSYRFLTLYINDIKNFIELMEESTVVRKE